MAGEAVNLAVFDADSMVLLYREQGPQSVTISSRLGSHRPMHASAVGKAFLSAMDESERRVLLGRISLKRYTDSTITSAVGARPGDRRDQERAATRSITASSRRRSPAPRLRSSIIAASRSRRSACPGRRSGSCRRSIASAASSPRPRKAISRAPRLRARRIALTLCEAAAYVSFNENIVPFNGIWRRDGATASGIRPASR